MDHQIFSFLLYIYGVVHLSSSVYIQENKRENQKIKYSRLNGFIQPTTKKTLSPNRNTCADGDAIQKNIRGQKKEEQQDKLAVQQVQNFLVYI